MIDFENLSVVEFAQEIRRRPAMFFGGDITLTKLEYTLYGFGINSSKVGKIPFNYFNYWVKQKLNTFGPMSNWAYALRKACNNDDKLAFTKFYELLDEFILLKPLKIYSTYLTTKNLFYYYSDSNKNKSYRIIGKENRGLISPAPYHIKLFEFDYGTHAYHFDYFWVVNESKTNTYPHHTPFTSPTKAKRFYKEMFGPVKWLLTEANCIEQEFQETIDNCISH